MLTPLVVDPAHPFPYISGLSLSLAVMIAEPETGATMFARVKVPPLLPRFLSVGRYRFVPLEDVIAAHLPELFVGLDILEHHVFRVTRNRELEIDEDVTEDLMQSMERELLRRRFEPAVRLEVEESISADVLERLVTELGVDRRAVYHLPGPLDLTGLNAIADLNIRRLKYPPFVPRGVGAAAGQRRVHHAGPGRRAGAPPVRLVRRHGGAADRGGGRRPAGAGHQADAVPDQRLLADRGRADRRGRGGQAGRGGGRAEGAVRRAGQHHLGPQAGGSGLPRGVRRARR